MGRPRASRQQLVEDGDPLALSRAWEQAWGVDWDVAFDVVLDVAWDLVLTVVWDMAWEVESFQ